MSTSPSDSIEIKDSDSESSRSSPVQLPQQSSPMVTRSKGRASARMPTPPQPPSSRTRKKSWMVNSTKMNTRSSQGKAKITSPVTSPGTIPVTNSVTSPVDDAPTASSGDVEVREPVAGPSQVHLPPNSNYTKARDASMVRTQCQKFGRLPIDTSSLLRSARHHKGCAIVRFLRGASMLTMPLHHRRPIRV